jgi:hypothetical protein
VSGEKDSASTSVRLARRRRGAATRGEDGARQPELRQLSLLAGVPLPALHHANTTYHRHHPSVLGLAYGAVNARSEHYRVMSPILANFSNFRMVLSCRRPGVSKRAKAKDHPGQRELMMTGWLHGGIRAP